MSVQELVRMTPPKNGPVIQAVSVPRNGGWKTYEGRGGVFALPADVAEKAQNEWGWMRVLEEGEGL